MIVGARKFRIGAAPCFNAVVCITVRVAKHCCQTVCKSACLSDSRRSHFWWKEALCRLPLPSPPGVRDGQLLCCPDYKTWKDGNPRRIPISINLIK